MIERAFDIPFVASLALREKQIQQNYRPIIGVHKWFARRPGTLFRAVLLSEFGTAPIRQEFYEGHALKHLHILDPFMGGGTTLIEANRAGCSVTGLDINPMAWWIVRQEIGELDLNAYALESQKLRTDLASEIGELYRTRCSVCRSLSAHVKYFLWVKTIECAQCRGEIDLFPNYLLSEDIRHPTNVFACRNCGELYDSPSRKQPCGCPHCKAAFTVEFTARRNRVTCRHCRAANVYPSKQTPAHSLFAIEYFCDTCSPRRQGRLFKKPDGADLQKFRDAESRLSKMRCRFIPDEAIPDGDETERLHRWGYRRYRDLFNARQLLGLELSCRIIEDVSDMRIREALATNLSDLLRYQNMLSRYDTMALKSLDVFSVHGFPVGLIQCESNLLGISSPKKPAPVGSGGWRNIIEKFAKAKRYCEQPFEIQHIGSRKQEVLIAGEWIGENRNGSQPPETREVRLLCADAAAADFKGDKFDAVLTDPPYFGNVQYAELMDFCYVWLRRLIGASHREFGLPSTRHANELTENVTLGRDQAHFAEGLSATFKRAADALKRGSPFVFTYHHNDLDAYIPVAVAIMDSRLVCSASLPCPAEMGASIHINGTGSSIVDTVFVCRDTGRFPRRWLVSDAKALAQLVREDAQKLAEGSLSVTQGDLRCISYGHLVRLAVWNLRIGWKANRPIAERLNAVRAWIESFGGPTAVLKALGDTFTGASREQIWEIREPHVSYGEKRDEISF